MLLGGTNLWRRSIEGGGILWASRDAAGARCRNAIPGSTAAASWLGGSFREARRCREVGERASRGGGLGNSRTLGMKVRSAAQRVARDMVGRYGRDAPRILRERAASAEEYGDDSEAAAWREIADIAERISERRWGMIRALFGLSPQRRARRARPRFPGVSAIRLTQIWRSATDRPLAASSRRPRSSRDGAGWACTNRRRRSNAPHKPTGFNEPRHCHGEW